MQRKELPMGEMANDILSSVSNAALDLAFEIRNAEWTLPFASGSAHTPRECKIDGRNVSAFRLFNGAPRSLKNKAPTAHSSDRHAAHCTPARCWANSPTRRQAGRGRCRHYAMEHDNRMDSEGRHIDETEKKRLQLF